MSWVDRHIFKYPYNYSYWMFTLLVIVLNYLDHRAITSIKDKMVETMV